MSRFFTGKPESKFNGEIQDTIQNTEHKIKSKLVYEILKSLADSSLEENLDGSSLEDKMVVCKANIQEAYMLTSAQMDELFNLKSLVKYLKPRYQ